MLGCTSGHRGLMEALVKRYIPARIVLFPGLGADARMFERQKRFFGNDLECPDWLEPEPDEALDDYTKRWAEQLHPEPDDTRPLFLGGVSFGGMIALEMARHLRPEAVILIGSCRSKLAKPDRWQVARKVGACIPQTLLGRTLRAAGGLWIAWLDQMDAPHRALMMRMAADTDAYRLRWGGYACADWTFDPRSETDFPPIYQIHGGRDAIIPLHRGDPDTILPNGRHVLVFSHPETVNRYIMDIVRQHVDG